MQSTPIALQHSLLLCGMAALPMLVLPPSPSD